MKIKDDKKSDKKCDQSPVQCIYFGFRYLTKNKDYCFDGLDKTAGLIAYSECFERLKVLSTMSIVQTIRIGKENGVESIPYSRLSDSMKQICKNSGIVSKDSKVWVFRFNQQKYRMICHSDLMAENLLHIIAFDLDYSAYSH